MSYSIESWEDKKSKRSRNGDGSLVILKGAIGLRIDYCALPIRFRSAFSALVVQLTCASIIFVPAYFLKLGAAFVFAPWLLMLLHALLSAVAAYSLRLEWWWVLIEFFFPFCFVTAVLAGLSGWVYFLIFSCLFLIYGATFQSRVPYFPSPDHVPELLSSILPGETFTFLDVGSGFGKVLLPLSKKFPRAYFSGVELALIPFVVSWLRGRLQVLPNLSVQMSDFHGADFGAYDVVYAYLSPVVMTEIWHKACNEMRHGTLFISYEFNVDGRKPDFEIQCHEDGAFLYCWKM